MTESAEIVLARITVKGVVQGVGFRPFVYKLAGDHRLNGWVLNTSEGVEIEVEGHRLAAEIIYSYLINHNFLSKTN